MHSPAVNLITPVNWQNPLNRRNIIGWWLVMPGNNGGSQLVNITKIGNDGTLTNMDTAEAWKGASRPGNWGALDFDGNNDYIDTGMPDAQKPTGALTISMWMRGLSSGPGIAGAGTMGASGVRGFDIGVDDGDRAQMRIAPNSTTTQSATATGLSISATTWHLWTGVYLPSTYIRIYQDSVLLDENTTSIASSQYVANGISFKIGRRGDDNINSIFDGVIDDVRMWNRALSASEIKSLYHDSRAGYPNTLNWIKRRLPVTAVGANAPTGHLYGSLVGSLGGPI